MVQPNASSESAGRQQRPTFLWHGLLILLPVAVLAVVGFLSLRQDKLIAKLEATDKAQSIANELAEKIWQEVAVIRDRGQLKYRSFQINTNGELTFPPPFSSVPAPSPLNPSELSESQGRLWQASQAFLNRKSPPAGAIEALQRFLQSDPPGRFAASAHFNLGSSHAAQGDMAKAVAEFKVVSEKYPEAAGETGLLLRPLAEVRSLQLTMPSTGSTNARPPLSLDVVCSNAVFHPTPVTPELLKQALEWEKGAGAARTVPRWQTIWEDHEELRRLFAFAHSQLLPEDQFEEVAKPAGPASQFLRASVPKITPRLLWLGIGPSLGRADERSPSLEDWIATRYDENSSGAWYVCRKLYYFRNLDKVSIIPVQPLFSVVIKSSNAVAETREMLERERSATPIDLLDLVEHPKGLPDYFGVSLTLAGQTIVASNNLDGLELASGGKGSGSHWVSTRKYPAPPILATRQNSAPPILATSTKVENGIEYLRLNVHLTSPQMLYLRQSERNFWFGLLIGVAALAALIGFVTTRRAFHKQEILAEMKTSFVSSVSHELRAPIASVRLMAEGLERGNVREPEKQHEYYRFIVQECRRLSALIENVLDFARIEQDRKQYEFEPTDLAALARQTVQLMEPPAAERKITLDCALPAGPVSAEVDGRALQQALVNLIDNALKHSPPGSTVTVGVELPALAARPDSLPAPTSLPLRILLYVEDHGEGIPPEDHERIFERFYRRGSELQRETQGVGIGLSIVKHIVEAHGGRVIVRGAVGQGSRFAIELPVEQTTGSEVR